MSKEHPMLFSPDMVLGILSGRKTQIRRPVTDQTSYTGTTVRLSGESCCYLWDFTNARKDQGGDSNPFMPNPRTAYLHVPFIHKYDVNRYIDKEWDTSDRVYPRIKAGDRIWVRETFRYWGFNDSGTVNVQYRADKKYAWVECENDERFVIYWSKHCDELLTLGVKDDPSTEALVFDEKLFNQIKWKPSIHMPRWASRITLLVKAVHVERLRGASDPKKNPWVWVYEITEEK